MTPADAAPEPETNPAKLDIMQLIDELNWLSTEAEALRSRAATLESENRRLRAEVERLRQEESAEAKPARRLRSREVEGRTPSPPPPGLASRRDFTEEQLRLAETALIEAVSPAFLKTMKGIIDDAHRQVDREEALRGPGRGRE